MVLLVGGRVPRLCGRQFRPQRGRRGYTLHARFDHIDGLASAPTCAWPGSRSAASRRRRSIPKTFQADVELHGQRRRSGCRRTAAPPSPATSLLGGKYLSLQAGGDERTIQPGGDHHHYPVVGQSRGTAWASSSSAPAHGEAVKDGAAAPAAGSRSRGRQPEAMIHRPPRSGRSRTARRCRAARSCACWRRTTPNSAQALQDAFEDAVLMGVDERRCAASCARWWAGWKARSGDEAGRAGPAPRRSPRRCWPPRSRRAPSFSSPPAHAARPRRAAAPTLAAGAAGTGSRPPPRPPPRRRRNRRPCRWCFRPPARASRARLPHRADHSVNHGAGHPTGHPPDSRRAPTGPPPAAQPLQPPTPAGATPLPPARTCGSRPIPPSSTC